MSDGRGTGAGSAPDSGQNDPRQGRQAPYAPEPEPRVLEGRVIPSQSNNPAPPQRRPGQSGHAPGVHAARRAARMASRQDPQSDPWQDPRQNPRPDTQPDGHPDAQPTRPDPDPGQARRPRWDPPQPLPQRTGPGPGSGGPGSGPGRQDPPAQPLTPTFQPRGTRRPDEPDWDALASASQSRSRKRRLLMIGGGVLAAALVAGGVAFAVVSSGEQGGEADDKPSAADPTGAESGEPEFPDITPPPPPDPLAIISSADKDTAPLTPETIFPGKRFSLGDRAYVEGPTSSTEDCAAVALKGLAPVLTTNGCRQVLRASYTRDGVSITVGIAVFDDKKSANAVRKQATGHIKPLTGDGVGTFCTPVSCWSSANAIGRYAYFTMAGLSDNTAVTSTETKAKQGGRDVSTFAFRQITQRGRDAAGQ